MSSISKRKTAIFGLEEGILFIGMGKIVSTNEVGAGEPNVAPDACDSGGPGGGRWRRW